MEEEVVETVTVEVEDRINFYFGLIIHTTTKKLQLTD